MSIVDTSVALAALGLPTSGDALDGRILSHAKPDLTALLVNRMAEVEADSAFAVTSDQPTITNSTGIDEPTLVGEPSEITQIARSGSVVTADTPVPHRLAVGDYVYIDGVVEDGTVGSEVNAYGGKRMVTAVPGLRSFTFTAGNTVAATPITSGLSYRRRPILIRAESSAFTYSLPRSLMVPPSSTPDWGRGLQMLRPKPPLAPNNFTPWHVEFVCEQASFEFVYYRYGYRIWVDGIPVSAKKTTVDSSYPFAYTKCVFNQARRRLIRIEFSLASSFVGVWVNDPASIGAPPETLRPRAVAFGDSFGEGTGAVDNLNGMYHILCRRLGWELHNMSTGSTGITTNGGTAGKYKYIDRLENDLRPYRADIVLVFASVNDAGNITVENSQALFDRIRLISPSARIIGLGPLFPKVQVPEEYLVSAANFKEACRSRAIPCIEGGIGLDGGPIWLTTANRSTYYAGTAATASAALSGAAVGAVSVTNAGDGYDIHHGAPAVSFSGGGGSGAAASAVMNYAVTDIQVLKGGAGYTSAPTVELKCGATAISRIAGGAIEAITVTNEGGNYFVAPTVTISGDGVNAAAHAVIEGGRVIRIEIDNNGSGFTAAPTITLRESTTMATATATVTNGAVTALTITNAGSGYTSCPRVIMTGGGGQGAEAVAHIAGTVQSVNVTAGGTGYTSAPSVAVAHPHNSPGDDTHPKTNGHQLIAEHFAAGIEQLAG